MRPLVAVTGAAGLVGSVLREALVEEVSLVGLDRRGPFRPVAGVRRANTARLRTAVRSLAGVEAVIDLAGDPRVGAPWDRITGNNVPAALATLEAARQVGAKRVVYASSNHVTGLYERDDPYARVVAGQYEGLQPGAVPLIGPDWPVRPDSPYAVGKITAEAAGRYYAEEHGLSVICVRVGTVNRGDRPTTARHFATLLSHRDLVGLFRCCLFAPDEVRYLVCYGVSRNSWRFWDIAGAEHELGYSPRDDAEAYRPPPGSTPA